MPDGTAPPSGPTPGPEPASHPEPARPRGTTLAVTLTAALSLAASACSSAAPRTIQPASAANQISARLAARYHVKAPAVSCPAGVPARRGRTFVCTTTLAGQPVRLDATVTDSSGRFSVTPADPILIPATVAAQLTREIGARTGRPATVHCPGGAVAVVPVHGSLTCHATFAGEPPRDVVVTVVDARGDFGFQLAPPG